MGRGRSSSTASFNPSALRATLDGYIADRQRLEQACTSQVVEWRWATSEMQCPLPYFDQIERGGSRHKKWKAVRRRWLASQNATSKSVRHGLDAQGRVRVFDDGPRHLLIDHAQGTDELILYLPGYEQLVRYIYHDGRLAVCYSVRYCDATEETVIWKGDRIVESLERIWIGEDGKYEEWDKVDAFHYHYDCDATGKLMAVVRDTVVGDRITERKELFRRKPPGSRR